jgi:hypothetical protein
MDPVLMVVWAVDAAVMVVRTQPQQFPRRAFNCACSEYWLKGMAVTS